MHELLRVQPSGSRSARFFSHNVFEATLKQVKSHDSVKCELTD